MMLGKPISLRDMESVVSELLSTKNQSSVSRSGKF